MSYLSRTISQVDDFASDLINPPRWNSWFRVWPVQFEGEEHPIPRRVRLCCPAARSGDLVQIIEGRQTISGRLVRIECSILHVAPCKRAESGAQSLTTRLGLPILTLKASSPVRSAHRTDERKQGYNSGDYYCAGQTRHVGNVTCNPFGHNSPLSAQRPALSRSANSTVNSFVLSAPAQG